MVIDIEGGEAGLFEQMSSLMGVRHIFFEIHAFIGPFAIYRLFDSLYKLGFVYDEANSNPKDYVATFTACAVET